MKNNNNHRATGKLLATTLCLPLSFTLPLLPGLGGGGRGEEGKQEEGISFTLLHTNDQHGHLLPFSYPSRVSLKDAVGKMPVTKDIGGIARRATLVKQIKAREKNCWLIDAGDCMDGSPFSVEYFAQADYAAMNAVGYDFGVFGNHDFNMTVPQFQALIKTPTFPLVLANVSEKKSGKPILPPYVIKEWGGLRVALFGLVTSSTKTYTAAKAAYKVDDPIPIATALVPELRKQADLVIAITHIGLDEDRQLARSVPGIDVIVGAHSHTRLPVGVIENGTIILQDHQWVGELGRLDFTAKRDAAGTWKIDHFTEKLLPITKALPEDPATAKVVVGYWDKIKAKYDEVIGETTADLTDTPDHDIQPTNYYLVCDAMAEATGADFYIENQAGVRAALLKGKITFGDIVGVDPFDNALYTFKIQGRDLKKLLGTLRPIPSASLRYSVKQRGTSRFGWELIGATLKGKPIDNDTYYFGAASSYLFSSAIRRVALDGKETGTTRRTVLVEYLKKHVPYSPREDGRVRFDGGNPLPPDPQ